MSEKSLSNLLLGLNTAFGFFIIGILLFVVGVAGGWSVLSLEIQSLPGQIALTIAGALTSISGAILFWREKTRSQYVQTQANNPYGVTIVSPSKTSMEEKTVPFLVSGTYKRDLGKAKIQIFLVYKNQYYWPVMKPGRFEAKNGIWKAEIKFGGSEGTKALMVATMDEAGTALCNYYYKVGQETNDQFWPSIETLTPDIVRCDEVTIYKKG